MTNPSLPLIHELIRSACSAPSVHNTQPWSWRVPDATTIELYADRNRQLRATDPRGRDLAISCGAALHHLTVAAQAFGLRCEVILLPSPGDEELLARIQIMVGHIETDSVAMLTALENRLSDRRGFSTWEVPDERLRHLCEAASEWGAHALPLTDPGARHRAEELIERARRAQAEDPRISEEQATWTDRFSAESVDDGIPAENAAPHHRSGTTHRPSRFDNSRAPSPPGTHEESTCSGSHGRAGRHLYNPRRPARLDGCRPGNERRVASCHAWRAGCDTGEPGHRGGANTSPSPARTVLLHGTRPDPAAHRLARCPARAAAQNATALARGRAAPLTGAPDQLARDESRARTSAAWVVGHDHVRERAATRGSPRPGRPHHHAGVLRGNRRLDQPSTLRGEYFQQVPHRHHAGELLAREHRQVTDVSLTHQLGSTQDRVLCWAVTTSVDITSPAVRWDRSAPTATWATTSRSDTRPTRLPDAHDGYRTHLIGGQHLRDLAQHGSGVDLRDRPDHHSPKWVARSYLVDHAGHHDCSPAWSAPRSRITFMAPVSSGLANTS